jgi:hypothetical protein
VVITDDLLELFDWLEPDERIDSPENERSSGVVNGLVIARRRGPTALGEGGDEGGVLELLNVIVGVFLVFVGVLRGVALGVTSGYMSPMPPLML